MTCMAFLYPNSLRLNHYNCDLYYLSKRTYKIPQYCEYELIYQDINMID